MAAERQHRGAYLGGFFAGILAVFSLWVLPLVGFTERIRYSPSDIWRDHALTGTGTYVFEFNLFEYPAEVDSVSYGALLLGFALLYPTVRCWRASRGRPGNDRGAATVSGVAGSVLVLLVLLAMFVLFPGAEEQTIWSTDSPGWLTDWWPDYGAFLALAAIVALTVVLAVTQRPAAGRAVPPPPPPAPPPRPPA